MNILKIVHSTDNRFGARFLASYLLLAVTILFAANSSLYAAGLTLPKHQSVPGGIALVEVSTALTDKSTPPEVFFQKNRVMVLPSDQQSQNWVAVVGIPLSTKPGTHALQLGNSKIDFQVIAKSYKEQRLTIKNKRQVNPLAEDLKRIKREKQEITEAFKHWNENTSEFSLFELPVTGEISSPFGLRRFFNEQPRKPHSGLDIAAPEGTPIFAPAGGVILTTGNYFFNGNTVLMGHNNGLITMYCHMKNIAVKPGVRIKKGEQIGSVGKTGRVTGPHLHWSVSLNNARVDPNLLLASP